MNRFLLPLLAALSVSPALAQDTTAADSLPEVVVTATRLPDIAAPIPNSTVITREEIATRQTVTLADLLQQEAGLVVLGTGGPLTSSAVFLRGAASKQVLVLIDGVRVNDANQGLFDLSLLRADDIERIEIARGAYSSQYGSDAIGGVIQVFTRRSAKAEVSARTGSFNTHELNAGARLGDARNGVSLRVGLLDTDGFSATASNYFAPDPDKDGGQMKTAQLSGQATFGERVNASFSTSWKEGRTEFDSGLNEQDVGLASTRLEHDILDNWTQTLQLGWLRNTLATDGRDDPFGAYYSGFNTQRDSASWLHRIEWTKGWTLVAGTDVSDEQAESRDLLANSTAFDKRLQNTGVFVAQYATLGIVSASASLREDRHDTFGNYGTGNATLAVQLLPALKLYGAYGSAFRAPSATDLYYPGFFGMFRGNPDLQPEEAREREVGVEVHHGGQHVRVSAYRNNVRDLIDYGSSMPFDLVNVKKARLQGVELDAGGRVADLRWKLNAGSQSAEDILGNDLVRRPQATFSGLLEYVFSDRFNAGTEARSRSSTRDGGKRLGGYTLFNVYAGWEVLPSLTLGARLENAGDKRYQEVLGYQTAERSGYVTATYAWR
ncbi:MAG: Outer rane vitamin receptor BtuB [Moraxellaceae bacterium]|jgi:vitamin B12 transporter|nr:Outer rane vitamin receptor BtuB [Moraxellaceae bacterium]